MIEKFFTKPLTRTEIWLTATGSFIVALAVLNRWIVTPLGLMSYGRVWQNHVSYMDIGFARRCLWGTLLTLTGLNEIPANEYSNAFFIHGIGLLALTLGIAIHMHGNAKKLTTAHAFIIFFFAYFYSAFGLFDRNSRLRPGMLTLCFGTLCPQLLDSWTSSRSRSPYPRSLFVFCSISRT